MKFECQNRINDMKEINGKADINFYLSSDTKKAETSRIISLRNPSSPIMCLYLIDKDSSPKETARSNVPLFNENQEKEHILALSIMFPPSDSPDKQSYVRLKSIKGK